MDLFFCWCCFFWINLNWKQSSMYCSCRHYFILLWKILLFFPEALMLFCFEYEPCSGILYLVLFYITISFLSSRRGKKRETHEHLSLYNVHLLLFLILDFSSLGRFSLLQSNWWFLSWRVVQILLDICSPVFLCLIIILLLFCQFFLLFSLIIIIIIFLLSSWLSWKKLYFYKKEMKKEKTVTLTPYVCSKMSEIPK